MSETEIGSCVFLEQVAFQGAQLNSIKIHNMMPLLLLHIHARARAHTCPAKIPHTPMIQRMLKTAEPTMVPTPTSPWVMKTPVRREEPIRSQQGRQPSGNI